MTSRTRLRLVGPCVQMISLKVRPLGEWGRHREGGERGVWEEGRKEVMGGGR